MVKSVLGYWFSVQLDYRSVAPAVFLAGKIGDGTMQFGFRVNQASVNGEAFFGNPYLRLRIGLQIPQPVRAGVFGDQVEAPIPMSEPDFDFARQTALAASRGEVKILLTVEAIGL